MSWSFNPNIADLIWYDTIDNILVENAIIDLGAFGDDLAIDTGTRTNDSSIIDQGQRVINGSI
jgi:hypothetical protein